MENRGCLKSNIDRRRVGGSIVHFVDPVINSRFRGILVFPMRNRKLSSQSNNAVITAETTHLVFSKITLVRGSHSVVIPIVTNALTEAVSIESLGGNG